MYLSEKERQILSLLASDAQNLCNRLKDTSQLSEKGHHLTLKSFDCAVFLSDRISMALEMLSNRIEKGVQ